MNWNLVDMPFVADIDAMPKGEHKKAPSRLGKQKTLTRGRHNVGNLEKSDAFNSDPTSEGETPSLDEENTLQQHIKKKLKSKQVVSPLIMSNGEPIEQSRRKKRKQIKKSSFERLLTSLSIKSKRSINRNITANLYNPIVVEKNEEAPRLNLHSDDFFSANERKFFAFM
jgi:hypothetical protein